MEPARVVARSGAVEIEGRCWGSGDVVLMLPGLGGDASQFSLLAGSLAGAGYRAVAVNPRGVGASRGPLEGLTLHDFAADGACVIETVGGAPAHVIGRAFGNRVARCLAMDRPELVRSLVLISAGGYATAVPGIHAAAGVPAGAGRDATAGLSPAAAAQRAATRATPVSEWWTAGRAPILVIKGLEDRIAPPENGRRLREELGERVRLVELAGVGHSPLTECPGTVAGHVLAFLRMQP